MLALLADENFRGPIIAGLREKYPEMDLVRAQDVGLRKTRDELVLQWAADHHRVLLTHDRKTMPVFAYARVGAGLLMPGVVVVVVRSVRRVIEEVALLGICGMPDDVQNQVRYVKV